MAEGQCLLGITISLLQSFHRLTFNLWEHFPNPLIDVVRLPRTLQWRHATQHAPDVAPQSLVRPASIVGVLLVVTFPVQDKVEAVRQSTAVSRELHKHRVVMLDKASSPTPHHHRVREAGGCQLKYPHRVLKRSSGKL